MPKLVRLFFVNSLIGYAIAMAFTMMIIAFDIAGIGQLVQRSDGGWFAAALFTVLNGNVFAAVQCGIAIMRMAKDDIDPPRGGGDRLARRYATIPVVVRGGRVTGPPRP